MKLRDQEQHKRVRATGLSRRPYVTSLGPCQALPHRQDCQLQCGLASSVCDDSVGALRVCRSERLDPIASLAPLRERLRD
jgi:hypothetical protein